MRKIIATAFVSMYCWNYNTDFAWQRFASRGTLQMEEEGEEIRSFAIQFVWLLCAACLVGVWATPIVFEEKRYAVRCQWISIKRRASAVRCYGRFFWFRCALFYAFTAVYKCTFGCNRFRHDLLALRLRQRGFACRAANSHCGFCYSLCASEFYSQRFVLASLLFVLLFARSKIK